MILSDRSIRDAIEAGVIWCDPEPVWDAQLQPASLDLRLGNEFLVFDEGQVPTALDYLHADQRLGELGIVPGKTRTDMLMTQAVFLNDQPYIEPGQFMLATTYESIRLPRDLVARVEGRSTLARIGLVVHVTAGFIDPGFDGQITLEMVNVGRHRIYLPRGLRICQVCFEKLDAPAERSYSGKYQGQQGATPSRIHADKVVT